MGTCGARIYGAGAVLLGLVGLAWGDFALQWQPVAQEVPGRTILAYANAAAMLAAGLAVQMRRWRPPAAAALAALFAVWVLLHTPGAAARPDNVGAWNGFAESLALTAGGFAALAGAGRLSQAARMAFGLCPLIFGTAHFVYADFTASMVPAWIPPSQYFWAYATGAGHLAAGLAILSGVQARLGSRLLGLMFAGFVVLLHVPRVFADPGSQLEWTMTAVALSLTGAAWAVADAIAAREPGGSLIEGVSDSPFR